MGIIFEWAIGIVNNDGSVSSVSDGIWPETVPEAMTHRGDEGLVGMSG